MSPAVLKRRIPLAVPNDASLPNLKLTPAQQRTGGDIVSPEVLAAAVKRADANKGRAQTARRQKATPKNKQTHGVDNDSVHNGNESARQIDTRDEVDRDSELPTSWVQPNLLDAPPPRPGFVNRYVRFRASSEEDAEHFQSMLDEGWRPVKRSRVKRVHELTASTHERYGQYYVKRGLILMELPEKLALQRARYYGNAQKLMNRGVNENLFKINDRRMPLLKPERSTQVSTRARRGRLDDQVPGDEGDDD